MYTDMLYKCIINLLFTCAFSVPDINLFFIRGSKAFKSFKLNSDSSNNGSIASRQLLLRANVSNNSTQIRHKVLLLYREKYINRKLHTLLQKYARPELLHHVKLQQFEVPTYFP